MDSRRQEMHEGRPVRPSFGDLLEAAGMQVELDTLIALDPDHAGVYRDIVRAIADVYVHRPESPSRVEDGIEYGILQEVFQDLTSEHVAAVCGSFCRYPRRVFSPRLFFQAALYNVLGELESGAENLYNSRR